MIPFCGLICLIWFCLIDADCYWFEKKAKKKEFLCLRLQFVE